MDEISFKSQLFKWRMNVRDAIIPTSGKIKLYGEGTKTKIISKDHEYLIYACVKPLKIEDELYNKLSEQMKMNDTQILEFVHAEHDQYLKDIRKQIITIQRAWSRGFSQYRARQVIQILGYENIYHICDLAIQRIVPIEILLHQVFNISSTYGDHRRIKDKVEVYMDPRVLKTYTELKRLKSTTIVHPRKT